MLFRSAYNAIANLLYEGGVRACLYLGNKKFGKQIDFAAKEHYSHVVIMGGNELCAGEVKIKNLQTREENTVNAAELAAFFMQKETAPSDVTWDDLMNGALK